MIAPVRLVRLPTNDAAGSDRCVVVSVEAATAAGAWMIRVARGTAFDVLSGGTAYGPVLSADLPDQVAKVLEQELAAGYVQITAAELVLALESPSAKVRGLAAQRLGWRRDRKAVAALLLAAQRATTDICPIVDALGRIGDPAAIELARTLASKKNLSRRRSGVEALRNLGDVDALALARQAGQERLPAGVAAALDAADESRVTKQAVALVEAAISAEDPRRAGVIADTLYERDTPLANRVVRRWIRGKSIREPHQWRYAKSILKRAMLRGDLTTFAVLAHAIERASLGFEGQTATVTSGLDGKKRPTVVFGKKTQAYVRRATWRYMRDLARYEPARYVEAAARIACCYAPTDAGQAKGKYGTYADAFLLNRILHGESERLVVHWRSLRHRTVSVSAVEPEPGMREEAFPHLWDRHPHWFLEMLARGRLPLVQAFGLAGVERHPHVLKEADASLLLTLAAIDRQAVVELVRAEIERRFQATDERWPLLHTLLTRAPTSLRDLTLYWLHATRQAWALDHERLFVCLNAADPPVRMQAAEVASPLVATAPPELRDRMASRLLDVLAGDEPQPGAHAAMVLLARNALVTELDTRFDLEALIAAIREASPAMKQVAGFLLGRRPGALQRLGLEGLVGLANHELVTVRRAGHAIVRGAAPQLEGDPSILYALVESDWDDTRSLAFELLKSFPLAALGVDGLLGLCDSTRPEVQALGRDLVVRHFEELQAETLLFRLAEHPAQLMRGYVLTLIRDHLRPGLVPLERIDGFVRSTLFDLRPSRPLKLGLLDFLLERGLMDERQGEHVVELLGDVLRSHTVLDFQRVSEAVTRIQVAYPEVRSDLRLKEQPA